MADILAAYRTARRAYREAFFAYQAASGPNFLPAMDAWIAADREVKRIEKLLATAQQAA